MRNLKQRKMEIDLGFSDVTLVAMWGGDCQETGMDVGRPASRIFHKTQHKRAGFMWKWQRWRQ